MPKNKKSSARRELATSKADKRELRQKTAATPAKTARVGKSASADKRRTAKKKKVMEAKGGRARTKG